MSRKPGEQRTASDHVESAFDCLVNGAYASAGAELSAAQRKLEHDNDG